MDKPIRLGILGPGRIVRRVASDFARTKNVAVTAVASRSIDRAREAQALLGARHAFGDYRSLADCADVDLVYVATPHNFHMEQSMLMMEAGKHVICEKPLVVDGDQARRLAACSRKNNVFLMEAMWTRFFPASARLRHLLAEGAIGRVRHFYAEFSFANAGDPADRLLNPALAGGGLLDVGIYTAAACSMVLGTDYTQAQVLGELAATGVDARASVQLKYSSGATAQWMCGFDAVGRSIELIYGSEGRIEIEDFWHPTALTVVKQGGARERIEFPAENEGFRHEFDHAADCIRQGLTESPVMPLAESIALADLLADLRARLGVPPVGEGRG
ncbi:MAG: Gfo/Idh/MocA family oxidoreductase [Clostridiales bacterium]|nr:Gfo/Idh/MocA family oxidoreductase [Clostridiales bacterium]